MSACPLVVLACESLHVCTVCIWRCEHARFCVEVFLCAIYKFSFIHSFISLSSSVLCYSALKSPPPHPLPPPHHPLVPTPSLFLFPLFLCFEPPPPPTLLPTPPPRPQPSECPLNLLPPLIPEIIATELRSLVHRRRSRRPEPEAAFRGAAASSLASLHPSPP